MKTTELIRRAPHIVARAKFSMPFRFEIGLQSVSKYDTQLECIAWRFLTDEARQLLKMEQLEEPVLLEVQTADEVLSIRAKIWDTEMIKLEEGGYYPWFRLYSVEIIERKEIHTDEFDRMNRLCDWLQDNPGACYIPREFD